MQLNDYNKKAIYDVYKNASIALNSLNDLLPSVDDKVIKEELKDQYDGYEKIVGEISSFMSECGIQAKEINPIKKAMLWSSIKMKTMIDSSRNQIAEMMIKGTVTGINELTAMKNEKENLTDEVYDYVVRLLEMEEDYQERLKKFL